VILLCNRFFFLYAFFANQSKKPRFTGILLLNIGLLHPFAHGQYFSFAFERKKKTLPP